MSDSFSFTLNGASTGSPTPIPDITVTVTQNDNGTVTIVASESVSSTFGDICALWFDIKDETKLATLTATSNVSPTADADVEGSGQNSQLAVAPHIIFSTGDDNQTVLSDNQNNLQGIGYGSDGGFDAAVQWDAVQPDRIDNYATVSFTLSAAGGLTLDDFRNCDFGIRIRATGIDGDGDGDGDGSTDGSWKITGNSGDGGGGGGGGGEVPGIHIDKVGSFDAGSDGYANVGEDVTYTFTVTNTGNVALSNVDVSDPLSGLSAITFTGGDTNSDGKLDLTETWTYSATYDVTQADIDAGNVHNLATATGDSPKGLEVTDDDPEDVALAQHAAIDLVKSNGGVVDSNADGRDSAGDTVVYTYTVENTGNVTLFNVDLSDDKLGGIVLTGLTDLDGDNQADDLAVGATVTGTATATLTQADMDAGSVVNVADVTAQDPNDEDVTDEDSNEVNPDQLPAIDIEKYVKIGSGDWVDADTIAGQPIADAFDTIKFKFVVTNTGNVTLHDVNVTDDKFDLNGALSGVNWNVGTLGVGNTAQLVINAPFESGQHTNTGTVTGLGPQDQGVSDTDSANYSGITGPGVRTPGYWSSKFGGQFWDGVVGNEEKAKGSDGIAGTADDKYFANGELLTAAEQSQSYLTLNGDGACKVKLGLDLAKALINASDKQVQDGRWMLGRDAVATELNLSAGNGGGSAADGTTPSPEHLLNDSAKWLKSMLAGADTDANGIYSLYEFKTATSKLLATSGDKWTNPSYIDGQHSAADCHTLLDGYNNTGMVNGTQFAFDGDTLF